MPETTARRGAKNQQIRALIEEVERLLPVSAIDRRALPLLVTLDRTPVEQRLGSTQGRRITIYSRALESSELFFYAVMHETGHAVFSLLVDVPRARFLKTIGLSARRWQALVIRATSAKDPLLMKAAVTEVRRIHEEFAESYAEYWCKRPYLEARAPAQLSYMRALFGSAAVESTDVATRSSPSRRRYLAVTDAPLAASPALV